MFWIVVTLALRVMMGSISESGYSVGLLGKQGNIFMTLNYVTCLILQIFIFLPSYYRCCFSNLV